MHKKISKAVVGSLMSAAMLASSAAAVIPMSANAGSLLGQSDFDEGVGLPWHTCESQPAKQKFELEDGQYIVTIINNDGPESRWDLQFRHRNIKITSGNKYHIEFDIESSADGELATHIADLKGENPVWLSGCEGTKAWNYSGQKDDNGYEHTKNSSNLVIKKGKNHFEGDFTADKTIEVAEWAFHYGGQGEWQDNDCFPNNTVLKFDNMILENLSSSADDFDLTNEFGVTRPRSNVRINQVGYYPNLEKTATYCTDNPEACTFELRDSSGKAVYTGKAKSVVKDADAGNGANDTVMIGKKEYPRKKDSGIYCQILDFSDFDKSGKYTIHVNDTVGVSDTISGLLKGAYDTKASGEKLIWTNPRSKVEYVMNDSAEFRIDENIYDDGLVRNSINYFYNNRSGIEIESKYITGSDAPNMAHKAGHTTDTAKVVESWTKFYDADFTDADSSYSITATGGWYDAGDHGKYVVNGGISVWQLQNTYELSKLLGTDAKWTGDLVKIPESGDKNPDILDEARYELEWMFDMIVSSKDPKWGDHAGFVYHKLHDHKWTGLATKAWDYEDEWGTHRLVKPPTYAATFNFIACAAQAARLWEDFDKSFADECLEKAKASYDAIMKFEKDWAIKAGTYAKREDTKSSVSPGDPFFAPDDQAIGGGPYGDNYVEDDAYWAACELYATTGDSAYYDFLSKYQNKNIAGDKAFTLTSSLAGGENKGSMSSFNWGCTAGLGTLSLFLNSKGYVSDADHKTIADSIKAAGDVYITRMHDKDNGMGIPYQGSEFTDPNNIGNDEETGEPIVISGYEWGSNSFVINNAIVLAYAYQATGDKTYLNATAEAMDYIFGRNGNGFSYVSGYGNFCLENPHHRYWCGGIDPEFPMCPAGVLSGGPGAGMQDPYVGGLGYKRGTVASQKCYVDSAEAWSVNEITINWNAPLVAISSYMSDVASTEKLIPGVKPSDPSTPGSTTTTTQTPGETGEYVAGDANCDGEVNMADAVLVMQAIANPDKYGENGSDATHITAQGKKNADVVGNDGMTNSDALSIQKYILKLVDKLPEA